MLDSSVSEFLHLKDQFGNDMYFGNTEEIQLPALYDTNFRGLMQTVRDLPLHRDDVFVVGFPKSGNNWLHHMISMLKAGTTDLPPVFRENSFEYLEGIGKNRHHPAADKPRIFFSHLPFRFLPREVTEKKVKIVFLIRNPKDVFVSLYGHMSSVKLPLGYEGTWPQFFTVMLEQGFWYGEMFDYLKDWQAEIEAHPEHPIYQCSYEDLKRDTVGVLEMLNQFLDTGRDRQLCEEIVWTCRLDNMHMTRRVNEELNKNVFLWKDHSARPKFYRKGVVGDWKNWFTVAQNEHFDKVYATKMADYKRSFQYE